LLDLKNRKEKEWYQKMNGFLDSAKLQKIEKKDEETEKLRFKIKRQTFRQRENPRPKTYAEFMAPEETQKTV
jgi:hypothetical protein